MNFLPNFFSTLKSRLLLLVLMAALPGLALAIFSHIGERQRAINHLHSDARMFLHEGLEKYARAVAQSPDESAAFRDAVQIPALPPDWVAMVLDGKGRILAHHPISENPSLPHLQEHELLKLRRAQQGEALVMARGVDGGERWYAAVPLGSEQRGVYLAVGGSRDALLAPINRRFIGQMAWLTLFLAAPLAFGWFFVSGALFRWARHALAVGQRFGAGEFDSRIDYRGNISELAQMSQTMDQLADTIQKNALQLEVNSRHIQRVNRLYAVLSEVNKTITQVGDQDELFRRVCHLAVEQGKFSMAWVGLVDPAEHCVKPVAECLAGDYLDGIHIALDAQPEGMGPTGTAIRENRLDICNDIRTDPRMAPWRDKALRHGYLASVAIPFHLGGQAIGALSLYAAEPGFFDKSEQDLLLEVGEDISMALATFQQVRLRQEADERVAHLSRHDLLTGLPNLALAQDRLGQDLVVAQHMNRVAALLLIDLNRFKVINDCLGLAMGDRALQEIARRLTRALREGDTVARLGGDEFAVILSRVSDAEDVALVASHVLGAIREQIKLDDREFNLTANIGISLFPRDGVDAESLFKTAKAALSRAQAAGRDGLCFFTADMNQLAARQMEIEAGLREALARNELELHYQPQANLFSGKVSSMEALLRWKSATLGPVSPAEFIPVAEESGLILPIGSWVLRTACAQNKAWQNSGLPPVLVAVNFSAHQFRHPDALAFVRDTLRETGLDSQYLELELTESMLMDDVEMAIRVMGELKAIGVSLSLDDFGTGYSSMSYLSRFSFDTLKIDQSFVRDITSNPVNATIATTTIAMAHSLRLNVVAEGVESESQLNFLRRHQCDIIQGYYFSRPIPAAEFGALLESGKGLNTSNGAESKPILLLVDDEPDILHALQRVLRRDGYRILTATSGREALELLSNHPVKVVVSDQRMPEMNGTEFLSRVKELHPATVRIMLTGYSDLKSLTDGINRGAIWKYLEKPWEERALRETLREAFRVAENRGNSASELG